MIEILVQCFLAYMGIGVFILYMSLFGEFDFEECGFVTIVLLWPLILIGVLIIGLMKICKVIANEWNRG